MLKHMPRGLGQCLALAAVAALAVAVPAGAKTTTYPVSGKQTVVLASSVKEVIVQSPTRPPVIWHNTSASSCGHHGRDAGHADRAAWRLGRATASREGVRTGP